MLWDPRGWWPHYIKPITIHTSRILYLPQHAAPVAAVPPGYWRLYPVSWIDQPILPTTLHYGPNMKETSIGVIF